MNLFHIEKEYTEIINNMYDPETGEIDNTQLERLQLNTGALEAKALALASWVKNMEAEAQAIKEAEQAMAVRRKQLERRMEQWENNLIEAMQKRGITEIKCPYFVMKLKNTRGSIDLFDKEIIPEKFVTKVVEEKYDKNAIYQALKAGDPVPGAKLVPSVSLQIK